MFGGERRWRFEQKPTKITKGGLPSLFPSFPSVDLQEFILQKTEDFFSRRPAAGASVENWAGDF
jgi:hypothetical protein